MRKYFKYFAIVTASLMFNCEADDPTTLSDYVGFEIGPLSTAVPKNATATKEVHVYASEEASTERTYSIQVDPASTLKAKYVVPGTVTIPANSKVGTFSISVTDDDTLGFVDQSLIVKFQAEAGLKFGNPVKINFTEECLETLVLLNITTDDWPEETTWELYDLSGAEPTVIHSGGPYPGAANRKKVLPIRFCLSAGEYGIVIYDKFGDGGASYEVTSGSTVYVPKTASKSAESSAKFTIK